MRILKIRYRRLSTFLTCRSSEFFRNRNTKDLPMYRRIDIDQHRQLVASNFTFSSGRSQLLTFASSPLCCTFENTLITARGKGFNVIACLYFLRCAAVTIRLNAEKTANSLYADTGCRLSILRNKECGDFALHRKLPWKARMIALWRLSASRNSYNFTLKIRGKIRNVSHNRLLIAFYKPS